MKKSKAMTITRKMTALLLAAAMILPLFAGTAQTAWAAESVSEPQETAEKTAETAESTENTENDGAEKTPVDDTASEEETVESSENAETVESTENTETVSDTEETAEVQESTASVEETVESSENAETVESTENTETSSDTEETAEAQESTASVEETEENTESAETEETKAAEETVESTENTQAAETPEQTTETTETAEQPTQEQAILVKKLTVSDGRTYKVTVTCTKKTAIPADAVLEVTEIAEDHADYEDYVARTADALNVDRLGYARVFDISIVSASTGEHYQPETGIKVTVKLTDREETTEEAKVVHFGETTEVMDSKVKADGTVEFKTDSFSVFVITDEDGTVVTPRAVYRFYDGNTEVSVQILKDQESLQDVAYTWSDNQVFLGWFLYENNTWGEQVVTGSPIQILTGSERAVYGNSVVAEEGTDRVEITVKARYTADYATVYFMTETMSQNVNEAGVVCNTARVGMPAGETSAQYAIPDVTQLSVTSATTGYQFVGWSTSRPAKKYYANDNREPITELTVTKGQKVLLYPVFAQANWMIFKTAPTGSGASYVSPAYVRAGQTAASSFPQDPVWRGYKFRYWTLTPTFDENGVFAAFADDAQPEPFDFAQKLTENVTLYAVWESGYTTYTVITWTQKVTDGKDADPQARSYEFAHQELREAKVGETVELTAADLAQELTGFHHRTESCRDSAGVTAASGGASVLNVFYDRNLITMRFTDGRDNFVYTGLYGQSLESNGYTWPDGMWYYENDEGSTTGMSFLGAFVLPDGVADATGCEIVLNRNGSAATKILFYLQNADGSWPAQASDTGNGTGGKFMFSEKYDGYTVDSYRRYYMSGKTVRYVDNNWVAARNANGSFKSVETSSSGFFGKTYYTLEIRYARRTYDINFYDSMDGQPLTVKTVNRTAAQVIADVRYGAQTAGFYPAADFAPAAKQPGYTFNGRWFSDRAQTVQVFFEDLTDADEAKLWYYVDASGEKIYIDRTATAAEQAMTLDADGRAYGRDEYELLPSMPMRNLAVYAGFTHNWYWIKIDPNGGELNPGRPDGTDSTYFWLQYGGVIREYETTREYVRDDAGSYYYHYAEFNTQDPNGEQPSPRRAWYNTDPTGTDGLRYRKAAGPQEGYAFAGWYRENEDGSLTPYNFDADIVTGNTVLKAVWKQRGAFAVVYSTEKALDRNGNEIAGLTVTGSAPADTFRYAENASVVVASGAVAAEGRSFVGWYFNNEVLTAGDVFTANPLLAQKDPAAAEDDSAAYDTFVLYPVFAAENEGGTEEAVTCLILDANGGTVTEGYEFPAQAVTAADGAQVTLSWSGLAVNADVTLPGTQNGLNVFSRSNAEFLGWAFSRTAKTPVFTAGQTVGVDNLAGNGYNGSGTNVLYAVWRMTEVSVKIRKVDANTASQPLAGAVFTMEDGRVLTSGKDGYLADEAGNTVLHLAAPAVPGTAATYVLTETAAPAGYQQLNGTLVITVDYDGTVTFSQEDGEAQEAITANGSLIVTVTNRKIPAPTGMSFASTPWLWILAGGILLAGAALPACRRRGEEEED